MECVVQGIIETQHVDALETLLQGLCGVPKERVRVHELCLKSGTNLGVVASEVRLLSDLAQPKPSWTARHVGGAMRGVGAEQLSVLVQTVVECKVGFAFRFHRGAQISVTVTSTSKMPKQYTIEEAVPVTPGIQMVEITAPAASDNTTKLLLPLPLFVNIWLRSCISQNPEFQLVLFPPLLLLLLLSLIAAVRCNNACHTFSVSELVSNTMAICSR